MPHEHHVATNRKARSTIQQELAQIIMRELNDPRLTGMPSITRVKVSADLSIADVFITIMGTPGQQTAALNALKHSAGMMRTKLTKALTLRMAPFLKFHIDEDLKKELDRAGAARKGRRGERRDRPQARRAAGMPPDRQAEGPQRTGQPTTTTMKNATNTPKSLSSACTRSGC